ncbi:MAG: cbb3-type cytochrome oxidase assembly protein CcoS [Magnetococcales bacterium]|nr:cbb3-type cytochrome oxidase assembly protein CcoS [Magnetococcales bacterium]
MNALYLLIPAALLLGGIGLGLMIWAVRNGQFEDLEGPAHRILFDDDQEQLPDQEQQHRKED